MAQGRKAIVVGRGLGADAEHVASLGFETFAFDVSPTAIRLARQRHRASSVRYLAADLLDPPADWLQAFGLVIEIITVQALLDPPRGQANRQRRLVGSPRRHAIGDRVAPRRPATAAVTLAAVLSHLVVQVDELAAAIEALSQRGLEPESEQRPAGPDGPRTSWLTDPDGYRIELVQWPAGHADGITAADFG